MANIVFYEKPGCINNSKQKKLLVDAGHSVHSRNLLTESWSRAALLEFFESLAVSDWFNSSAPDIKSGLINPEELEEDSVLDMMIENPILIRRPLMRSGSECHVGFDSEAVDHWVGLGTGLLREENQTYEDVETCTQVSSHNCIPVADEESLHTKVQK